METPKEESSSQKFNRQTAYIVSVNEIHSSIYTKSEGEWEPNYLPIRNRKVSRVNLIGVVINVEEGENKGFSIDDGTGTISIRIFDPEQSQPRVEIGDIILVIGRPREYNNEKYIVPEIIKEIKNGLWMELRKKELDKFGALKPVEEPKTQIVEETSKNESPKTEEIVQDSPQTDSEKIFSIIKKIDSGEGADIDEVVKQVNIQDGEKTINSLLAEGEIFEVKPGRIKVLE